MSRKAKLPTCQGISAFGVLCAVDGRAQRNKSLHHGVEALRAAPSVGFIQLLCAEAELAPAKTGKKIIRQNNSFGIVLPLGRKGAMSDVESSDPTESLCLFARRLCHFHRIQHIRAFVVKAFFFKGHAGFLVSTSGRNSRWVFVVKYKQLTEIQKVVL